MSDPAKVHKAVSALRGWQSTREIAGNRTPGGPG